MQTRHASIDLTDLRACGVYYVTPEDIDTLASEADTDRFNVHHVDLTGCRDLVTFTARLAAGLSLPDAYARDWETLVDYLENMDGLPSRGHVVLISHPEEWRQADHAQSGQVLDTLEEITAIWANEGVAFFVFLPQKISTADAVLSS